VADVLGAAAAAMTQSVELSTKVTDVLTRFALCLYKGSILDLGREIKKRFRKEIGEWMSCNMAL
jgi:hypothetical protein